MMNYKVRITDRWKMEHPLEQPVNWGQSNPVGGYFLHEVVETATDQIIKTNMTQSEAKALARHLNMGGSFDGFTPAFFCVDTSGINRLDDYEEPTENSK
jgi:hypothetical protein